MKKTIFALIWLAMLTSCGIYGKYTRPEHITGDSIYGRGVAENSDSATLGSLSYKTLFTDPCLQVLIEQALARNADLRSLELAIRQAEESYQASKLAFAPGLSFAPQGGYNLPEGTEGWGYTVPVAMNWEIDLFGKLRNQKRRAGAALQMTEEACEAAKTYIVAQTASLYFQLLKLDSQVLLTDSTARKWQETVRVMQLLKDAGVVNEVSVAQTEATCMEIVISLRDLQRAIHKTENALCLLLKQPPQSIRRGSMQQQVLPEQLQVGVPAQLLSNRPDVRQAEHNLAQYFYGVQHARSLFYPSLTISATAGFSGRFVPSLVGSLLQPIFARGAIKSNLRIAKAQYEQALVQFEQKLLEAGTEVNNALLQCSAARDKRSIRAEQIAALEQAMEHTQLLMSHGTTTYLEVIYAQQSLLKAQTEQMEDWLDEAQGVVALYRALGGGTK